MSDDLFYTDLEGEQAMLVDVIDDGLEGELDDRIPELRRLLSEGDAEERLNAARMLVAWADPVGIEALLYWAEHPDESPGAAVNRFTGGDATFARLADALRTSQYSVRADEHDAQRVDAAPRAAGARRRARLRARPRRRADERRAAHAARPRARSPPPTGRSSAVEAGARAGLRPRHPGREPPDAAGQGGRRRPPRSSPSA